MRSAVIRLSSLVLLIGAVQLPPASAAPPNAAYHIVVPRRPLGPGERVELKLEPPPPANVRVVSAVSTGGNPSSLQSQIYIAPFVIPVGTPPVTVSMGFSTPTGRFGAFVEIELVPGSMAGAEDCLGPGQSFSTFGGSIVPDYTYMDELPELIHRVEPEYPRSAYVRGVEDTLQVKMLVCRSGRVLDAFVLQRFRDLTTFEPIESDPKLVEAAEGAARQFVFKPGLVAGSPVAAWVISTIQFRR